MINFIANLPWGFKNSHLGYKESIFIMTVVVLATIVINYKFRKK